MIEQLVTWSPSPPKSQKTDIVMAFWFAELACRDRVVANANYVRSHVKNSFATPWDKSTQTTVSLVDSEIQGLFKPMGV